MADRHDIQLHHHTGRSSWYRIRAFGARSIDHAKRIALHSGLLTSHAVAHGDDQLVIVDFRPQARCQYRYTRRVVHVGADTTNLHWYWQREDIPAGTEHIDREWHVLGVN